MIKKIGTVIAASLVIGCVSPPYIPTIANIGVVGDSNTCGFGSKMAPEYLGIASNCLIGRSLHDIDYLPDWDIVFLNLGINGPRSEQEFTDQLNELIGSTSAIVVCVLPVSLIESKSLMQREVMRNECIEWVDPYDAPVTIQEWYNGVYDGVHYTDDFSQERMSKLYEARIIELGYTL